jgi:hypothetical protein
MHEPGGSPLGVGAVSGIKGLPEGVEDQRGLLAGGDPPAQDPPGEHVDDERDVAEPGQRPHA